MVLQRNEGVNLRLAAARTGRLLIRPGETFSFNEVVGSCTRRKGYVEACAPPTATRHSSEP